MSAGARVRQAAGLLLLSTGGLVLSIYLGEFFLSMRGDGDGRESAAKAVRRAASVWGNAFDPRPLHDVVAALREGGLDAYPPYFPCGPAASCRPALDVSIPDGMLPLGGVSQRTVVVCNETGQYLAYRTDEHGFNNPPGIWGGPVNIASVGDSFTEGLCVSPELNVSGRLRGVWPRTLNLGKGGNGPLLMLATLQEHIRPERPPVVLWMFFEGNDLQDLRIEQRSPVLARYLDGEGGLGVVHERQADVDSMVLSWLEDARHREAAVAQPRKTPFTSVVASFLKLRRTRGLIATAFPRKPRPEQSSRDIALFARILETADREVRGWGGRMYFVYLPSWERYHDALPEDAEVVRAQVLASAGDLGIPSVDPQTAFDSHPDPSALFAQRDFRSAHYSVEGYALVAEQLIEALSREKALPAPLPTRAPETVRRETLTAPPPP